MKDKSSLQRFSIFRELKTRIDQDCNDEPGMIGVLAFNTIKTFKTARINLLKQAGIEKAFMVW
ncbi:MAG: hypothetical protein PHY54_12920 [Methylococcales bacterium]|nr:hypothetical protein [Methylococcales bacterium]